MTRLVYWLEPSRRAQRTTPGQLRVHTPYAEVRITISITFGALRGRCHSFASRHRLRGIRGEWPPRGNGDLGGVEAREGESCFEGRRHLVHARNSLNRALGHSAGGIPSRARVVVNLALSWLARCEGLADQAMRKRTRGGATAEFLERQVCDGGVDVSVGPSGVAEGGGGGARGRGVAGLMGLANHKPH